MKSEPDTQRNQSAHTAEGFKFGKEVRMQELGSKDRLPEISPALPRRTGSRAACFCLCWGMSTSSPERSAPPTPCAAPPQRCPGAREGTARPCQRPGLRTSFRATQRAEKYWGRGGAGGVCLLGRVHGNKNRGGCGKDRRKKKSCRCVALTFSRKGRPDPPCTAIPLLLRRWH